MFQLSQPGELFSHQTLYRLNANVDKRAPIAIGPCRLVVAMPQPVSALAEPVKEMVEKLITACKVDTKEVVYADALSSDISYQAIQNTYHPGVILYFGDLPISRNLTGLKRNLPYEFNGTKILLAQTLEHIAKTPVEKNALWAGLQKLFKLK